jgi:hypothetical protein
LVQHDGDPGYAGCHHQMLRIDCIDGKLAFSSGNGKQEESEINTSSRLLLSS